MKNLIYIIHPIIQLSAIMIVMTVIYSGSKRFKSRHLKINSRFKWKSHVFWGSICLPLLLCGIIAGIFTVKIMWEKIFITGLHGGIGLVLLPVILFSITTGFFMNKNKINSNKTALSHALSGLLITSLVLIQMVTGILVLKEFVLGL